MLKNISLSIGSKKFKDQNFHPKKHGGARNFRFPNKLRKYLELIVYYLFKEDPSRPYNKIQRIIYSRTGIKVTKSWLCRLIRKKWGLRWLTIEERAIQKFSTENIEYYPVYLLNVAQIPKRRLKFFDKSHFEQNRKFIT